MKDSTTLRVSLLFATAGAGGWIAKYPTWLTIAFLSFAAILGLCAALRDGGVKSIIIWISCSILALVSIAFVLKFSQWESASPATKTIAIYEMNHNRDWVGRENEPINLTENPTLEGNDDPEKRRLYFLKPAVKHESVGSAINITLTIAIPNGYGLRFRWFENRRIWTKKSTNGYTEFTEKIEPSVESGDYGRADDLGFEEPTSGIYEITYRIKGTDNKGRSVTPGDTIVKVNFK